MASYPAEIRRCEHIKTSGAQCGSPALREKQFCYYHEENRTVAAEIYLDGDTYCDGQMMLPPFEDAHAIQMTLQHVVRLMLQRRIDRKDAATMLYALQIASTNLKRMEGEKPKPTQVVREPEKVGETPMGRTPWSASGKGHDPEVEGEEGSDTPVSECEAMSDDMYYSLNSDQRVKLRSDFQDKGLVEWQEVDEYLLGNGKDPLKLAMRKLCEERERRFQVAVAGGLAMRKLCEERERRLGAAAGGELAGGDAGVAGDSGQEPA